MMISLIAVVADNAVMGYQNKMPWHLPEDLQHFKRLTWGKPIIMGRKTYESLGKPLPGRPNIVLSRQPANSVEGSYWVKNLAEAWQQARQLLANQTEEIMVIGGAQIYQAAMPYAQKMYLTRIYQAYPGDTFFPAWSTADWQQTSLVPGTSQANKAIKFNHYIYQRKGTAQPLAITD